MQPPAPEWDEAPFYASATRPKLTDGCDRSLYSLNILTCTLIPYWNQTLWSAAAALTLFFSIRYLLRRLGKHDPLALKVYLRNLAYYAFYGSRTKYTARLRTYPKQWVRS